MAIQIQLRRGTALEWTNANTILSIGEIGVEHDTGKFKLGNGTSNWNSLQYFTTIITGSSYPITSSWATNVISSSFSTTASYTLNTISASYSLTASYALNGGSSGSGGTTLTTGSTYPITSSWSNNSLTASYLNPISQSLIPSTGSTYSLGSPTNKWKDLYVSSGSIYVGETVLSTSGSTLFVNSSPAVTLNTASGQLEVGGFTASLSSSYSSTASVALNALTSSYSLNSVSSSYSVTASYALNAGSGTTLTTGSTYPITSSWATNARSSSFAITSSYVISASAAESFHPFLLA
jgi:hypothetical protein